MPNRSSITSTQADPSADGVAAPASPTLERGRSIGDAIRLLHVLLVVSVVVPVAAFVFAAWYDWREIHHQSMQRAARTVQILREHALKVFESHEFAIDQIEERVHGMDWNAIRASEDLHRYLARMARRQHLLTGIALIAPDGIVASTSNAFPVPRIDLSDRSQYTTAKAGNRSIFIGEPLGGRVTGERVVIVSRARATPAGTFDGVLAIGISLDRFTEFYRGITAIQENSITLLRTDGVVMVREPPVTTGASKLTPATAFMRTARTGEMVYRSIGELDGIERIHTVVPVGSYPVYVSYGLSLAGMRSEWLRDVLLFGLFAAIASIGLSSVSLLALRRVRNEQRLVTQWQDEVQRREAAERALRQSQKMEALGQLTGGVAHDFNNLLMVISGNIELLKKKAAGTGADRQITAIEHAARNGEALTRKLLSFSRRGLAKAASIEVAPFAAKVVDLLKPSLPPEIEIVSQIPPDIWYVKADAHDLELSIVNIVLNARDAMSNGGTVTLLARNRTLRADDPTTEHLAGDFVELSIRDNGSGIAPENLSRVFEPFFTTKEVGRGTGLGLSQVYGFAKQSAGAVTIDSTPGRGTTVTLYLPRSDAPPAKPVERPQGAVKTSGTILLVEDNKAVAEATAAMLESLGCSVQHAIAAEPALELLANGAKFDLVLSDIVMPGGIDGVELARTLRTRYPTLAVLLTTGYSTAAQKAAGEKFPILLKPYQIEELRKAIDEAVGSAAMV